MMLFLSEMRVLCIKIIGLNPDHYCLIKSSGYHLDTVLSPVINKSGELIAFILNKENISENGFKKIKKLNKKIKKMEIKHQYSPLTYFRFAGGSFHCLTNEIYK